MDTRVTVRFAQGDRVFPRGRDVLSLAPDGAGPPPMTTASSVGSTSRRASDTGVPSRFPTLDAARAKFRSVFRGGFADAVYHTKERREKWRAHEQFVARLGGGPGGCGRGRALLDGRQARTGRG